MYGVYKIYSSWVATVKLGRQAANELQAASCIELGLQSSWAGMSSWRRRRAASPIELGCDAPEKLRPR